MEIQETTFGPKKYLAIKKTIAISQVSDKQMYEEAGQKLGVYIGQHGLVISGPWSVMYFTWDQEAGQTDMAIAFPVQEITEIAPESADEFSIVEIPESKAALGVMAGSYEGLAEAHGKMMEYAKSHSHVKGDAAAMAVEEYEVGPMQNQDTQAWKTNIYYLRQ